MTRRVVTVLAVAAAFAIVPGAASAHGIGGRLDLPVPLSFFVVGAGVALVVSFIALSALWPEPRLQSMGERRPLEASWLPLAVTVLRVLGLLALALVVLTGFVNGDRRTIGPALVWIYFWLVVPFLVAFAGNFWPWLSPWRSLAWAVNGRVVERSDLTERLGIWPATVAFVAFTWLELVYRNPGEPRPLAIAALVYVFYVLAVTSWVGVEPGLRSFDFMESYTRLLGSISPLGWRVPATGPGAQTLVETSRPTLEWRGWLRALPSLPVVPGLVWFVIAMIGTVTYDGMSATSWWEEAFLDVAGEAWFGTVALLTTVAAIGLAYYAASWVAVRLARSSGRPWEVAQRFAHTLVPIALAYAVAHYFTLVLFEGQLLLHTLSDPFGLGWNLFGTADWRVVFFLSPTVVWYVQVATIVLGHVAGVVLAHDRALADFGQERGVQTQYAMLLLMVGLTSLGLFVLAG